MKNLKARIAPLLGIIVMVAIIGFSMAACGGDDDGGHTHSYSTTWSYDTTQHWHECIAGDGAKSGVANHTGDPCTVCGYDTSATDVTFSSLTANGNATTTTTTLTLTFSQAITGLAATDITITGVANATTGTLSNTTGGTYTLGISGFTAGGTLTVAVAKQGYNITPASKTVTIYHYTPGNSFVAVTNITGVPTTATIGTALTLTGTVEPSTATNKTIAWSVKSAGTTGATISGSSLNTTAAGSVTVTATIANGTAQGTNYTKDFNITVSAGGPIGPTWTAVSNSTFGTSDYINGIAYGGGTFVAVGLYGKMATSPDGASWTAVSNNNTFGQYGSIYSIAYGDDKFVAGGSSGNMATSPDGTTWTVAGSTFNVDDIRAIAYGDDKFVAVGTSGKMATSTNGTTWTPVLISTFGGSDYIIAIAYGGGKFIAVGNTIDSGGNYTSGKMATSPDGATWTAVANSTFGTSNIWGIAYGDDKFVAVGSSGQMATSPDGEEWTAVSNSAFGTSDYIIGIAYGGGKFVAVENGGKTATSPDGTTWTAVSNSTFGTSAVEAIAYGNKKFVIGGSSGKMAYSNDQE